MTQDELYDQFMAGAGLRGWTVLKDDLPELLSMELLPRPEDIFRALEEISPDKVRFLVLGQDPYPTISNGIPDATGIAFAVRRDHAGPLPHSLRRIMNNIYAPSELRGAAPDLQEWRERHQVLLLNAALTVDANSPRSHLPLWRKFTVSMVRQVRLANPEAQLVSWGKDARDLLIEALNMFTWCHHPAARVGGERGFSAFWNTPVGQALRT